MTVLVTGGAGYIGSHMVLELLDAGEHVVVLDNLSTGFAWAVPEAARIRRGRRRRRGAGAARRSSEHGIDAIIHFAGSIVVPESVADPLGYYLNNTVKSRALIEAAVECRRAATSSSPRPPPSTACRATEPVARGRAARADVALRHLQADDRDDAGRCGARPRSALRGAALLQRRRRRPAGSLRPVDAARDAPHQGRLRDGARQARHMEVFGTDYPTPDGTCVRDYIHVTDLARAHMAALAPSARRRRQRRLQLRLRPRASRCWR